MWDGKCSVWLRCADEKRTSYNLCYVLSPPHDWFLGAVWLARLLNNSDLFTSLGLTEEVAGSNPAEIILFARHTRSDGWAAILFVLDR